MYTYGQISSKYIKQQNGMPHNKHIADIHSRIVHTNLRGKSQNTMYITESQKRTPFEEVTFKEVYEELIKLQYQEHHSKQKWVKKFGKADIPWPKV